VRVKMRLLILSILLLSSFTLSVKSQQKPNIVFLLADDFGHFSVGWRNPEIRTPVLDSLRENGVELDRHYVYKYCSPTRSSFLTGRLPIHVNEQNSNWREPGAGIPLGMTLISEKLKKVGYATHHVGKWHAGQASLSHIPYGRGFDSSLGFFSGGESHWDQRLSACNGVYADLWDNDKPAYGLNGTDYTDALFLTRALSTITTHDTSIPLFLYMAFQVTHNPLQVPQEYLDLYPLVYYPERKYYYAMATYLDDAVGKIVGALKEKGIWENTIVVFSSDNGGPTYVDAGSNNYPLKGGKASDWEGGVRATALATGGLIPAEIRGTKIEGYIHICDWYATFCKLAGIDPADNNIPGLPAIDSLDIWPLISGQTTISPRTEIPLSSFPGINGVPTAVNFIDGPWKFISGIIPFSGWTGPVYPNSTGIHLGLEYYQNCVGGCLYHIIADPNEYYELSATYPGIFEEMSIKSRNLFSTVYNPDRGVPDPKACQVIQEVGYFSPWLP